MDSLATKEQVDNIDMACSMMLFGGLSPEPKYRPSKSPMASPDLTAKGLMESPSYLGTEVIVWRGRSRYQILSLHPMNILTAQNAGAAAERAAHNKECKYAALSQS